MGLASDLSAGRGSGNPSVGTCQQWNAEISFVTTVSDSNHGTIPVYLYIYICKYIYIYIYIPGGKALRVGVSGYT